MTETIPCMNGEMRPHGTRHAMHVKHRLERIMPKPELYDIRVGGGCAVIEPPSLDADVVRLIEKAVDIRIYYIREDGIYVH